MASLKKLGIKFNYDNSKRAEVLHYSISIDSGRLTNPKEQKKYFAEIIDSISGHAHKKKGLNNLRISVDEEYLTPLQIAAQDLAYRANEQRIIRKEFFLNPKPYQAMVIGGAVIGGIGGLIFGCEKMPEVAANISESTLIQTWISFVGSAITTVSGSVGGTVIGDIISSPYMHAKFPLAGKAKRYKSLEHALKRELINN